MHDVVVPAAKSWPSACPRDVAGGWHRWRGRCGALKQALKQKKRIRLHPQCAVAAVCALEQHTLPPLWQLSPAFRGNTIRAVCTSICLWPSPKGHPKLTGGPDNVASTWWNSIFQNLVLYVTFVPTLLKSNCGKDLAFNAGSCSRQGPREMIEICCIHISWRLIQVQCTQNN